MKETAYQRYMRWWGGKLISFNVHPEPKRVKDIELVGPPSFVYGSVVIYFDDGTSGRVDPPGLVFRPRKSDVTVWEEGA